MNLGAQITGVEFLIEYNNSTELYDCKIAITSGQATTYSQRVQFNSQYTLVVPHGTTLSIEQLHNPKEDNQFYLGTTPCLWEFSQSAFGPSVTPDLDYHSISPNLSPASAYNNLFAGDTITLFSVSADVDPCENLIRPFDNDFDPLSDQLQNGGDFSNGFVFWSRWASLCWQYTYCV